MKQLIASSSVEKVFNEFKLGAPVPNTTKAASLSNTTALLKIFKDVNSGAERSEYQTVFDDIIHSISAVLLVVEETNFTRSKFVELRTPLIVINHNYSILREQTEERARILEQVAKEAILELHRSIQTALRAAFEEMPYEWRSCTDIARQLRVLSAVESQDKVVQELLFPYTFSADYGGVELSFPGMENVDPDDPPKERTIEEHFPRKLIR